MVYAEKKKINKYGRAKKERRERRKRVIKGRRRRGRKKKQKVFSLQVSSSQRCTNCDFTNGEHTYTHVRANRNKNENLLLST